MPTTRLRFAQEEKELDMKGIAESEALVKPLREEVDQNLFVAPAECGKDRDTSCAVSGRWSTSTVGTRAHGVAPTSCTEGGEPCKKRLHYVPMSTEDVVQRVGRPSEKDLAC